MKQSFAKIFCRLISLVAGITCGLTGCAALADSSRLAPPFAVTEQPSPPGAVIARVAPPPEDTVTATPPPTPDVITQGPFVYGHSAEGRPLIAHRLGQGPSARALIGGLHGGYEWNTTELVSRTLEHLSASPEAIPDELTLYIVPLANPDGAAAGTDAVYGRMNGNGVDLNRNWDYQWQMTATHGLRPVLAGARPFSEPETRALRDLIQERDVGVVIFYHSAGGVVFSGAGDETSQTVALAKRMADVTGYRYAPEGVPGQITTGDAIDWLTHQGITAIEIELTTHADIDWERNLKGLGAFLEWELPDLTDE